MRGALTATKMPHILYSATRKELVPMRMASYSSWSRSVCVQPAARADGVGESVGGAVRRGWEL